MNTRIRVTVTVRSRVSIRVNSGELTDKYHVVIERHVKKPAVYQNTGGRRRSIV